VVEKPEELIFSNAGHFLPQSIDAVIEYDSPAKYYRNRFLTQAMFNLNMIDTIGSGIKKMFMIQRERNFPLPTYDLTIPEELTVRIYGKILDENYTRMLFHHTDLELKTVIALDKVQKRATITREEARSLRAKRLVEGRYPNIFVTSGIASITDEKAKYIKYRAFNEAHYRKMVLDYLREFGSATRKDIDELLLYFTWPYMRLLS
jgi:ATP-dependent DNA helicase RecG